MIKPNAGNRVSYVAKLAKASARGARGTAATVPASARTYTGMRLAAAACGLRKFLAACLRATLMASSPFAAIESSSGG
jgi:hypothetical protein